MNEKTFASWKESYDKSIQNIKKQRHHFANKCPYSESYVFSSSHVRAVSGCKIWAIKKAEGWRIECFQVVVLEKTLESPLVSKEIKSLNLKGNQPWIFTGKTDAEPEAPIILPPNSKSWFIIKDPGTGKDWRQEEKEVTEDETVR